MRVCGLVAILLALPAASARADVEDGWSLAEGCPSVEDARARAAVALADSPPARLDVRIEATEAGYAARLTLRGAVEADRAIQDPDCDALVNAALVLAALALGLPSPEPPAPPPAPEPAAPPPPPPVEGPSATPMLRLAVGGLVDTLLPSPSLAIRADVGLGYDALRVDAGVRWLPAAAHTRDGGAQGADFFGVLAALRVGAMAPVWQDAGRLELGAYARGEVGVLHGDGYGVAVPESGDAVLVTAGLDAAVAWWPVALVGFELSAGLTVPVLRPRFELDGRPLFAPAEAGFRAALTVWLSIG